MQLASTGRCDYYILMNFWWRNKTRNAVQKAQATAALTKLKPIRNKKRSLRSLVMSIFLYAHQSRKLNADTVRLIRTIEMRCYRRVLRISNEELRWKIKKILLDYMLTFWPPFDNGNWDGVGTLLTHLLAKTTIIHGTVNGWKRRGAEDTLVR